MLALIARERRGKGESPELNKMKYCLRVFYKGDLVYKIYVKDVYAGTMAYESFMEKRNRNSYNFTIDEIGKW